MSAKLRPNFRPPATDALVGDNHASFGQEQFDIPQAETEHVVEPYGVGDDLGWEAVPAVYSAASPDCCEKVDAAALEHAVNRRAKGTPYWSAPLRVDRLGDLD